MSDVADRARGLARIAAVQAEMVRAAEWKLAAARGRRECLAEERRHLAALLTGETPLGVGLGRAAMRTAAGLDARIAASNRDIADLDAALRALRFRDKAVASLSGEARAAARRAVEAVALAETMEAWFARDSLP